MWGSGSKWPSASKEDVKEGARQPGRQGGPTVATAASSQHAALSAPPGYMGPRQGGLDLSLDSIISQRIGVSLLAGQDTQPPPPQPPQPPQPPLEHLAQQRQQQHVQEQQLRQLKQQQRQQQQWLHHQQQLLQQQQLHQQQQFQHLQSKAELQPPQEAQKMQGSPSASKVSWNPIRVSREALPNAVRNSVPAGTQELADRVPPGAHPLQWVLVVHALAVLRNLPPASFQACVFTIHTRAKTADSASALALLSSQLPSAELGTLPKSSAELAHKFVEMFVKESTLVRNLTKTKYFRSLEAKSNEAAKLEERVRHLELEENMQASHIQGLETEVARMYTLEEELARLKAKMSETSSAAATEPVMQQKRALTPEEEEEERRKREKAAENEKALAVLVEQFAEAKKIIAAQEDAKSKEIAKAQELEKQLEGVNAELEEASSLLEEQQKELTAASRSIRDAVNSEKAALEKLAEQQKELEELTLRHEKDKTNLEITNASQFKELAQLRLEHGSVTVDIARLRRTTLEEANKVEMLQKDVKRLVEDRATLQRREQQLSGTLQDSRDVITELRQALADAAAQSGIRKSAAVAAERESTREMEKAEALKERQQEEYERRREAEEKNRRLQFEQSWERELEMRRAVENERLQQELEAWKKEEMHKIEQERLRILGAEKEAREKREAQEKKDAQERREAQERRDAQERRAAQERREAEEKRETEEKRLALEKRVAQEKRENREKREAQEREEGDSLKEKEKVAEEREAVAKAAAATPKNTTTVPRIYLNNLKKKLEASVQRSRFLEAQLVIDQGKIEELTRKVKALPASFSTETSSEAEGSIPPTEETVRVPELASEPEDAPVKPRPVSLFTDRFRFTGSKRTSSVAMEEDPAVSAKRTRTQSLDREETVEGSPSASQAEAPSSTPRRKLRRRKPIVTQKRTGMAPSQSSPVSSPAPKKVRSDLEMKEAKQKAEEAKERARREQLAREETTRARLLRAQEVRAKLQKAEERRRAMLKAKLTEKDALSVKKAHQRKAKWEQLRKFKEKKDGLLSALEDERLAEETAAMVDSLPGASVGVEEDSILTLEGPTSPLLSPLTDSDLIGALGSSVTDSGATPEAGFLLGLPMGSASQSFLEEPLLQGSLPEAMVTDEADGALAAGDTSTPLGEESQPLKTSATTSEEGSTSLEEEVASQESGDTPGDKDAAPALSKALEAEAERGASSSVGGTPLQDGDTVMEEAGPTGSTPAPSGAQEEDQEMAEATSTQSEAPVQGDAADPEPAQTQKKMKKKRKKKKKKSLATTGPVLFGPGGSTLGGGPAANVATEREEGEIVEGQEPRVQSIGEAPSKGPADLVPETPAGKQQQQGDAPSEREPGEVPEEKEPGEIEEDKEPCEVSRGLLGTPEQKEPGEITEDKEPGQVAVEKEPGEISEGEDADSPAKKRAAAVAQEEQVLGDKSAEKKDEVADELETAEKVVKRQEKAQQSTEVQTSTAKAAPTDLAPGSSVTTPGRDSETGAASEASGVSDALPGQPAGQASVDKAPATAASEQGGSSPALGLDLGEDLDSVVCFDAM